jgi:uncharacterized protein YegP (UPF0339 family)
MPAQTRYKIEIVPAAADCWHWRIKSAKHGQIIVTSETYASKTGALNTVRAFVKNMTSETPDKLPIEVLDRAN